MSWRPHQCQATRAKYVSFRRPGSIAERGASGPHEHLHVRSRGVEQRLEPVLDEVVELDTPGDDPLHGQPPGGRNQLPWEINGSRGSVAWDLEDLNVLRV